jgi:hypothetical protein
MNRTDCKIARCVQPTRDLAVVAGSDRTEQRQQRTVVRPVALRAQIALMVGSVHAGTSRPTRAISR